MIQMGVGGSDKKKKPILKTLTSNGNYLFLGYTNINHNFVVLFPFQLLRLGHESLVNRRVKRKSKKGSTCHAK